MREFLTTFTLVLLSFVALSLIFSFFELVGDIIRNRTPLITVGDYLLNLIPYMLYNLTPLCALLATLVTLGSLSRSSELIAMKASGVSIYRLIMPILALAGILAVALFGFSEFYLPAANRQQESLRSVIKGQAGTDVSAARPQMDQRPAGFGRRACAHLLLPVFRRGSQCIRQPDRVRVPARQLSPEPTYFRQLSSLGTRAHSIGSLRTAGNALLEGEAVSTYKPFTTEMFTEIREQPSYFKKESRQSQEMSFSELDNYIHDLQQSGLRHHATARAVEPEARISPDYAGDGNFRGAVCVECRQARLTGRRGHRDRRGRCLHGHRKYLRCHGQRQRSATDAGGVVP